MEVAKPTVLQTAFSEKKPRHIILYHQFCSDGWCALAVADLHFAAVERQGGAKAHYVGVVAGKTDAAVDKLIAEEHPNSVVMAFDLTFEYYPAKKLMTHFSAQIYDHHVSTESCYRQPDGESDEEFAKTQKMFATRLFYDKSISGATLAWKCFFPRLNVPLLVQYVQDRDLWTWIMPDSKAINAGLSEVLVTPDFGSKQKSTLTKDEHTARKIREWSQYLLTTSWIVQAKTVGNIILSQQDRAIKGLYRLGASYTIDGLAVRVCSTILNISELGNHICQVFDTATPKRKFKYDFAVLWRLDHKRNVCMVSMRSRKGDVDISKIAEQFEYIDADGNRTKGGGHEAAAGFETTLPKFFEWIGSEALVPSKP
jgi:oligoribonuclease NrnB/cAMP/cGMP phosphodiesterase (DHH superfamily)